MSFDVDVGTNCWTKAEDTIAAALPKMVAFQELTEKSTETEAAKHVFGEYWPPPLVEEAKTRDEHEELLAGALIYAAEDEPYGVANINGVNRAFGSTVVRIRRSVREADMKDLPQVERFLKNMIGNLIDQLLTHFRTTKGRDWARSILVTEKPEHSSFNMIPSTGDLHECDLLIAWGGQGVAQ